MCSSDLRSPGWVHGGARGPTGGHRGGYTGAPGLSPAVTGVGPRGRPGSRQRSLGWVIGGARGLTGVHRGGSSGVPRFSPVFTGVGGIQIKETSTNLQIELSLTEMS